MIGNWLPTQLAVQQLEKFGTQFHGAQFYQKADIGSFHEHTPVNLSGVDLLPPTLSEVYLRNRIQLNAPPQP
jgi:hypothetical protein